jgi:ferrous iron transport protein B
LVALALKRTLLRGATPVFVMELPAYKWPTLRTVIRRMTDAGWAFVRRAGTIILASMILVWAALYFPDKNAAGQSYPVLVAGQQEIVEPLREEEKKAKDAKVDLPKEKRAALEAEEAELARLLGEWKRNSYLGRIGRALEPAFTPLGWDWKIGMAALASFPAREVVVGTLSIIYNLGDVDDDKMDALRDTVQSEWRADPVRGKYAVPVALSLMVFFALCCQCASTLAVIRRETRSWAWPAFTFGYMTALAYIAALATFQIGRLIVDAVG